MKPRRINGFSLLELAIALAILTILIGGTLKGRSLIQGAKVQATAAEITALETAIAAFESRYAALPGDFRAATAAGLGNNGDGNDEIDSLAEEGAVWFQLSKAGFIKGDFDGSELVTSGQCPTSTCRTSPMGGTMLVTNRLQANGLPAGKLLVTLGSDHPATLIAELDRKLDDGKPDSGSLRALSSADTDCLATAAGETYWNEAANPDCSAAYVLR